MKKLFLLFVSTFLLSCSIEKEKVLPTIVEKTIVEKSVTNISSIQNIVVNEKKGAKLEVKFDFPKAFKTKASINGIPAKTTNDIQSVKLYITKSNGTNPLSATNLVFSSGILTYVAGSVTQSYTFNNVPAGTYFVAAELFSDTLATQNIVEPITYDSLLVGDTANGFASGKRGLTLSSNSCTVAVTTLAVTFSDASLNFKVAPALLNGVGAQLDTTISATAGSTTLPAITAN